MFVIKSILEILFYNYVTEKKCSEFTNIIDIELEENEKRLKVNLNKKQKKLLLRITDAKDLIKENSNRESFITGFKIGLKVGYESNKD